MKRFLSLFLSLAILLFVCVIPVAATEAINESDTPMAEDINVNAYAAIVLDMKTGRVLYEHDADEKNYPASTTKIMTAYLALKYGDPDDMVTVSKDAFSDLSDLASTWDTVVGEEMRVYRALQEMLVVSASECANVIGEYISGSREEFVNLMNEEAQALGCTNTNFVNCHGLPRSQHYTTARDLATIAMAAMEYEEFREIVGSAVTVLEATNIHGVQSITSTNGILPGSSYPLYNYPYAIGIKTGHTSVAGYVLVSAANKDDTELLCVVMGCNTRESSFAQTIKLYDWAYENYDILTYGWETADPADDGAQVVPEAPEYEEVESSTAEEEEIIIVEELGDPISESAAETTSSADTASEQQADQPVAEPTAEDSAVEADTSATEDDTSFSWIILSDAFLPVIISFGVAIVLLVILVIILIVILSRRKRKRTNSRKRQKS